MDICSWNWGVIASIVSALITGFVAIYISSKWEEQKSSEVLSSEAEKVLSLLIDYKKALISLDSCLNKYPKNDSEKKLEELREIAHSLNHQSSLFSELIHHGKEEISGIEEISTRFYSEVSMLNKATFPEIRESKKADTLISRYDIDIQVPKSILIDYFKHKSVKKKMWCSKNSYR